MAPGLCGRMPEGDRGQRAPRVVGSSRWPPLWLVEHDGRKSADRRLVCRQPGARCRARLDGLVRLRSLEKGPARVVTTGMYGSFACRSWCTSSDRF